MLGEPTRAQVCGDGHESIPTTTGDPSAIKIPESHFRLVLCPLDLSTYIAPRPLFARPGLRAPLHVPGGYRGTHGTELRFRTSLRASGCKDAKIGEMMERERTELGLRSVRSVYCAWTTRAEVATDDHSITKSSPFDHPMKCHILTETGVSLARRPSM